MEQGGLRRELGVFDVCMLTVNSVLGSAIFFAVAILPRTVPDPTAMLTLWAVGGVLTLAGAVTYAELGSMYPHAGGQYHYLKEAYGPLWGFLFGWTSFWVIQTGAIAFLAVAVADMGVALRFGDAQLIALRLPLWGRWGLDVSWSNVLACALIAAITAVNYAGLRAGTRMQNAVAVVKVASLLVFIACGLAVEPVRPDYLSGSTASTSFAGMDLPAMTTAVGAAMIGLLWCFDGWYQPLLCSGEVRDPGRNLVRGMVAGVAAVTVLYVLVNVVYLRALSPLEMGQSPRVGEAAAGALFGVGGAHVMALAIGVSILGCLASCILTGARAYLPMAQDGLFFKWLAKVHPVYRTPGGCLIAQALWAMALAFTGTYETLGTYVIFAVFLFHTATGVAVFVLRRTQPGRPRAYRAWGYPWTPLLFILTSLAFVASTLWERPIESLLGLGLVVLGVPAYRWWRHRAGQTVAGDGVAIASPEAPAQAKS